MQALFVLDRRQPAAGKIALEPILHRAAVSHMIVSGDDIAMLRQKFRKLVIASDMLGDAVNQLNNSLRLPFRLPERAVQTACAAGIEIEFFHYRWCSFQKSGLSYIKSDRIASEKHRRKF